MAGTIKIGEAARILGVSRTSLYRWAREEKVPSMRSPNSNHVWFTARQIRMIQQRMEKKGDK